MKLSMKTVAVILVCVSVVVLACAAGSLAAVDSAAESATPPVVTGRQLMQEKIDFLMSTLKARLAQLPETERPALFLGEDFTNVSGLEKLEEDVINPNHPLHDAVKKAGRLHQDSEKRPALMDDANLYLNLAILDTLDALLKDSSMADDVKNTVFALIDLLKELELPEAYQVPDTRFGFTGLGRPDDRDRTDRGIISEDSPIDPVPDQGFKYYGKPYDLDTDVTVDDRGFIVFSDGLVDTRGIGFGSVDLEDNMPAMLSPLVSHPEVGGIVVSGGGVEKTSLRYTYRWKAEYDWQQQYKMTDRVVATATASLLQPEIPAMETSASLYRNDWIVFNYESKTGNGVFPFLPMPGIAGLSPGDGGEGTGHPGEGQPRDWESGAGFVLGALFESSPLTYDVDDDTYTAIYNGFATDYIGEGKIITSLPVVFADTFYIFRPYAWGEEGYVETPNKYMVSVGTRRILAGGLSSLDEAIEYVADDPGLLEGIDGGEFIPGNYEYGLQAVGMDDRLINGDGFLAYAVQVEEDIVNRKILEMHHQAIESKLEDTVSTAKGFTNIRERDAWLTRQADAQAGRVLRDHKGNWVRVQQYVLRPDDNTVQILSASLRDVAGKSELSTLDFTTTFLNGGYSVDSDLRKLPWNSWLNTLTGFAKGGVDFKYVYTTKNAPLLESMTVTIQNPSDDTFQESRTFAGELFKCYSKQLVTSEFLRVNDELFSNLYDYDAPDPSAIEYTIESEAGGFSYHIADRSDPINVSLYELSDSSGYRSKHKFKDIWDTLRVNEDGAKNIGASSLEMVITDGAQTPRFNEFDVVYIPMSRMLWKDKTVAPRSEPAS